MFNLPKLLTLLSQNIQKFPELHCHFFETLPSTNSQLWQLLEQGASPGTVVIAAQQTAGRGQWGRQWQSELGGLYLSLLLSPHCPVSQAGQLTIWSAWGLATVLRSRSIPVLLKWPNDLMLQDRKLGGILIETRIAEAEIVRVVIGVGINWENPVPDTGINLRSFLNSTAANSLINPLCDLEALAAIVVQGLVMGYQTWQRQGLTSLLSDYQALLTTLGRSVRVEGQAGIVTGVTANGHLKVQLLSDHSEQEYQPGRISIGY